MITKQLRIPKNKQINYAFNAKSNFRKNPWALPDVRFELIVE
jgi:hypothetical protein